MVEDMVEDIDEVLRWSKYPWCIYTYKPSRRIKANTVISPPECPNACELIVNSY